LRIVARSEALAVIIPVPYQNKGLYAPGLLNALGNILPSNNQAPDAEDVVAEHPPTGHIVPVQASADDAEPLTTEIKGVEVLQEGSGGWVDVETTMTSTDELSGNRGAFVAPLSGCTSGDSAKDSGEEEE
ncbi:unnamed protein product, partial [Ectocarpus sp. 12 AP-2014]